MKEKTKPSLQPKTKQTNTHTATKQLNKGWGEGANSFAREDVYLSF